MIDNPYKYRGALDPIKDELVCVPRKDQIKEVVRGINWGEYWAIIAPRQFGKSTFLRQLQKDYTDPYYISFDFTVSPKTEEDFYQWIAEKLIEEIPTGSTGKIDTGTIKNSIDFLDFLMGIELKNDRKKIVMLFDEIELIPSINNFLHVWRKLFHERHSKKELEKYSIIMTGSVDVIKETKGETSPFNIASTHYIESFSVSESEKLINDPFKKAGIKIDKNAKKKLISEISGHPQLLQQTCHILFENASKQKKDITVKDVDDAIETLLKQSDNLDTLKQDFKLNAILEELTREILGGKKLGYLPYKEFSYAGAGPIIEDENGCCAIRNNVYETFLKEMIKVLPTPHKKSLPKVFICCSSKDQKWQEALSGALNIDRLENLLIWEAQNSRGKPKEELYQVIEEYIDTADISIFFISENSLTPDFLLENAILTLIKEKTKQGKNIFPVWVPSAAWKNIKKLAEVVRPCKD